MRVPVRIARAVLTAAIVFLAGSAGRVLAADPAADPTAGTGATTLWCSAADPGARAVYVSDLVRVARPTRFRLWDYQSRFAQAVSGAGAAVSIERDAGCRTAHDPAAAAAARSTLIRETQDEQWQVVLLGVF